MDVYATMVYDVNSNQWINLVLSEKGSIINAGRYDTYLECEHQMMEKTKATLNRLFGEVGLKNDYKIHVVDINDERYVKLIDVHTKKELRKTKFLFRIIDKIDNWFTMYWFNRSKRK